MGFSSRQVRALRRAVIAKHVRTRAAHGRELSYIEGWHAVAEANRIFGFDGWDRETVESRCVLAREARGLFSAVYVAKVRITVRANGAVIVREGHGTGEGRGGSAGETHEIALKGAETDATKRALTTFGMPFGLALYTNSKPVAGPTRDAGKSPGANNGLAHVERFERHYRPAPVQDLRTAPQQRLQRIGSEPLTTSDDDGVIDHQSAVMNRVDADDDLQSVPFSRIDKSVLVIGHTLRRRHKGHLRHVAAKPCLVCGRAPSDAHHLRFAQARAMGAKVSDEFTVPLCRIHHRELHRSGDERAWWETVRIEPEVVASKLWCDTMKISGEASETNETDSETDGQRIAPTQSSIMSQR